MRISERKRQLREQGENPDALAQRQAKRASAQAQPVARKPSARAQSSAGQKSQAKDTAAPAANTRARKPRGSGFYTGFGVFGLCFAIIFGITTFNQYRSDSDSYPTKVKQYHAAQVKYPEQLAQYNEAVAKHANPLPAKPKAPTPPTKPELSAGSFALPVLYALLSIAYLYLGYRARTQSATSSTRAPPAKKAGAKD